MCLAVYIASDVPLPAVPWDGSKPAFNVAELSTQDEVVRKHFAKAHVYYLGSHESCGCGFQYGEYADIDAPEDIDARIRSRHDLVEYVRSALTAQASVELFACWEGDQSHVPEHREELTLDQLATRTYFREKEYIRIRS